MARVTQKRTGGPVRPPVNYRCSGDEGGRAQSQKAWFHAALTVRPTYPRSGDNWGPDYGQLPSILTPC